MKVYKDKRGWRYRVMRGIGEPVTYKARYNKPSGGGWKCVRTLSWRETREEAEEDLARYAARHKMQVVESRSDVSRTYNAKDERRSRAIRRAAHVLETAGFEQYLIAGTDVRESAEGFDLIDYEQNVQASLHAYAAMVGNLIETLSSESSVPMEELFSAAMMYAQETRKQRPAKEAKHGTE